MMNRIAGRYILWTVAHRAELISAGAKGNQERKNHDPKQITRYCHRLGDLAIMAQKCWSRKK